MQQPLLATVLSKALWVHSAIDVEANAPSCHTYGLLQVCKCFLGAFQGTAASAHEAPRPENPAGRARSMAMSGAMAECLVVGDFAALPEHSQSTSRKI